jgi:GT2 family glycosyltransferase
MLSFIVPARSQPDETRGCLTSILHSIRALGIESSSEFVLLDDESRPEYGILNLFKEFRAATQQPVTIARFKKNQHYTGVFAYGLSLAKGDGVFFISNDMVLPPQWFRAVLGVSALDASYGIIRGTADLVDSHPEHSVVPPYEPQSLADVENFAEFISKRFGLSHTIDPILSGDAVLIKRSLIDAIGVLDKRFFGYFSDVDYGIRAMRSGFKLVCAKGAWLRHYGAGHIRADRETDKTSIEQSHQKRMAMVQAAYAQFRLKWDMTLPEQYRGDMPLVFDNALNAKKMKGFDYVAPLKIDAAHMDMH